MLKNVLIAVALLAGVGALTLSLINRPEKIVFVDMGKVYASFALTRELNAELDRVMQSRRIVSDSLSGDMQEKTVELRKKNNKSLADIQQLAKAEEAYLYKKQMFEKDNQAIAAEYNSRIWNQLNQYLSDYGRENDLSLLLGANGQGNIMYGRDGMNATKQVLAYVNQRYQGGGRSK